MACVLFSGSKSPEALRARLNASIAQKDKTALERAIIDCEEAGYPELGTDLRKARDILEDLGGGRGG